MKKIKHYFFVFMFILAACGTPTTLAPVPTTIPPLPTNTIAPTATLEPSLTPDPLIFRDDFKDSIDTEWQWVKENNKTWSLTNNPGWLEIHAGSGHVSSGDLDNLLIRQIPEGNFELETKLMFKPVTNYQIAGLLIYESAANFIQYGRAYCNEPRCVDDGLYMDLIMGSSFTSDNFAISSPDMNPLYLRLRREGNIFTSYFSEDGNKWQLVGTHTNEMNPLFVGLVAGQSTYSFQPAQFDYFIINSLP
jgi:beta-xylosidase